jgi:hypothetical protein
MFFTQCSFLSSSNLDFESNLFDQNLKILADSVIRALKIHYEELHTHEIKPIKIAVLDIIVTKNDFNISTGLADSSNKYR